MTKKQKITLVSIFLVILIAVGGIAGLLNYRETQEGTKKFQVEVISERDNFSQISECKAEVEYLGEFIRTFEECEWEESEYGIYIIGFYGMQQDLDQQYWWCITVNDQEVSLGCDSIPLQDGDKYTFTLMQGW